MLKKKIKTYWQKNKFFKLFLISLKLRLKKNLNLLGKVKQNIKYFFLLLILYLLLY